MGAFADWQPIYAEHGLATFPVREKRPAVSHYLKMGLRASAQLPRRFANDDAFGIACRPNKIVVLDVDAPDEKLLADAICEFGETPFIVRSGSGNFQAWYRHNGEKRRVRPDPSRPIDILGDGFVVAAPSKSAKGDYSIIRGSLDDLRRLPTMRQSSAAQAVQSDPASLKVREGERNQTLWRKCMVVAKECGEVGELMGKAVEMNRAMFYEPLPDEEVLRIVASAWAKETSGDNWFGRGGRVVLDAAEVDGLLNSDPDAFLLLTVLRRHHWRREFVIANAMAETMPCGGWRRQRFTTARRRLIELGTIEEVRAASPQLGPAVYKFKVGNNGHQ